MSQATADITARSTISIPTSEELGESRFLIHCLDWDGYVKLLKLFGDDGPGSLTSMERSNSCRPDQSTNSGANCSGEW